MNQLTSKERTALRAYALHPLRDGDVVLLVDQEQAVELEAMADMWEGPDLPRLVQVLGRPRRVVVAVARVGADLHCVDMELGSALRSQLEPGGAVVPPALALPAVPSERYLAQLREEAHLDASDDLEDELDEEPG